MSYVIIYSKSLSHHGIKGQKWGVRRYQNEYGEWTSAGRKRYGKGGETRGDYKTDSEKVTGNRIDRKTSEQKKLSKGAKAAIIAGAAVGGVAVGLISTREINGRAREVSDILRTHGERVISNIKDEARLVEALNADDFEYDPYHGAGKELAKSINQGIQEFASKKGATARKELLDKVKDTGFKSMTKLSDTTIDALGVYAKGRGNTEILMHYVQNVGKELYLDPAVAKAKTLASKGTEVYGSISGKTVEEIRKLLNLE